MVELQWRMGADYGKIRHRMRKLIISILLVFFAWNTFSQEIPIVTWEGGIVQTFEDYVLESDQRFGHGSYYSGGSIILQQGLLFHTSSTVNLDGNWSSRTFKFINSGKVDTFYASYNYPAGSWRYYRAYMITATDTTYGETRYFYVPGNEISPPSVYTNSIEDITANSATSGGYVSDDGNGTVSARGVVWNTTGSPDLSDSKTTDGSGLGSFTSYLTGLTPGTTYYVRAYATNSAGTGYGGTFSFTTASGGTIPTVATASITDLDESSATSGGYVIDTGGSSVSARGIVYSTSSLPTLSDSYTTDGSGTGAFTSSLTGLSMGVTYYVRAYATNSSGTAYGGQVSFTTHDLADVIVNSVLNITSSSVDLTGEVLYDTGTTPVTERGFLYSTSPGVDINDSKESSGSGEGTYSISLTSLTPSTTYYFRAYAINSVGIRYDTEHSFTTLPESATLATVTTTIPVDITSYSAILGGNVTADGGATVTDRGVVYNTTGNPTTADTKVQIGSGMGSFSQNVTGLQSSTTYYVRAYAINSEGTAYGNQLNFTTLTDVVACDAGSSYPGGESYPTEITYSLGTETGVVTLDFTPQNIPDRFIVYYDGNLVIDTGYWGHSNYDYGGSNRAAFTNALTGKIDPESGFAYPNILLWPGDGYPRVHEGYSSSKSFTKSTEYPTNVTVRVYAPMGGTAWSFILSCPN